MMSFCLSLAAFLTPAYAATLSLEVLSSPVAGSQFDVNVVATRVFDSPHDGFDVLLSYGFNVTTGHTWLTFMGYTPGTLFMSTETSAQVSAVAAEAFILPEDFVDPLILATLTFSALEAGASSISISSIPLDPDTGLAYLTSTDEILASANLVVQPTPEPGTFGLMMLAGAGLILCGRGGRFRSGAK